MESKKNFYKVEVKHTTDANKFRPAAISFEDTGRYTPAPKGTREYKRYWKEEIERSIHGYVTEDGEYITGYNYFYLNFCRINVTKYRTYTDKRGITREKKERFESFPWFYDYDRAYFDAVEEAENRGQHIALIKKRGSGYSFKGGGMLCRNFYCLPKSKSYAIASEMEFLTRDGLISKAWEMMAFIDQHTGMGKKRQKIDQSTHKRASFIKRSEDGTELEIGYKSEIMAISLKNDPQKARGKRGKLILWEEAGKFPNLKTAWQIARPSVEDDDGIAYGLTVAYGTGGSEDTDFDGLKDIFYEPLPYNCLEIQNDWDEGIAETSCGFFVPQYYNMSGTDKEGIPYMDANGNSRVRASLKFIATEREKVVNYASDRSSIDRYIAERPITIQEACLSISTNIFPKKELLGHLAEIRNSKALSSYKQVGELNWKTDGTLAWGLNPRLKDLTKYRLSPGDSKEGAIVIWEHPVEDPPYGLYVAGCDPYDHDKSTTNSLGSCFIFKRFQSFEKFYDLPVAEYTARPETANEFYENVRKLVKYYGATLLYENEKKGLFTYFEQKHCEYLLADQPGTIKDVIRDSKVKRGKGIHMNKEIKQWGEGLIKDYLIEEFSPGQKNLLKIYSEPLLEELINFNDDGNFDRVMAYMMVMIYREELFQVQVKQKKDENYNKILFPKPLFTHNF